MTAAVPVRGGALVKKHRFFLYVSVRLRQRQGGGIDLVRSRNAAASFEDCRAVAEQRQLCPTFTCGVCDGQCASVPCKRLVRPPTEHRDFGETVESARFSF